MCQLSGPGSPWIIYGITSWGVGCARAYTLGVYVKVSVFLSIGLKKRPDSSLYWKSTVTEILILNRIFNEKWP